MTDLEDAHMAGFMEGVGLVQNSIRDETPICDVFEWADFKELLERVNGKVALAVANRMEAV